MNDPAILPFLQSVARAYAGNEPSRLLDFCFVFPNKRSATIFTDFMAGEIRRGERKDAVIHPECMTIVDFVGSFSSSVQADRMEMIFMLYEAYCKAVSQHGAASTSAIIDFNKFVYWADVLINDFDDVDTSLADPAEVFRNVETLKEISANYLTSEQLEILRHYWSDDQLPQEVSHFWNHIVYPGAENSQGNTLSVGFIRLWQVMREIYTAFQEALSSRRLHTTGMAYRRAVDFLEHCTADDLPFTRYIFVGFNNLSAAEKAIFSRLREMRDPSTGEGMADFYWDGASPVLRNKRLAAARVIQRYIADFPSRYDCITRFDSFPVIDIIGVPSRVGQTKVIGRILNHDFPSGEPVDQERLRRTSVVLPEENTLTPLLSSMPDHIEPLNITMGYKLRNTSVSGLMKNIVSMQLRAYRSDVAKTFFRDDVLSVLAHPLVRGFRHLECTRIIGEIERNRYFNVPEELFKTKAGGVFAPVFTMVADKNSGQEVFGYLLGLMKWISEAVRSWLPDDEDMPDTDDEESAQGESVSRSGAIARSVAMQEAFIRRYTAAVIKLQKLCSSYLEGKDVFVEDSTVFNLVERIVSGEMLNFEGIPLRGLQIMGVLEARALDFDTLILPSMNERIFPRARFTTSFIPMALRKAYGLTTPEDQETAYTYFFYRMISRAAKVYLLYDARSSGVKSRQMSRYISQLIHIFKPEGMTHRVLPYHLMSPEQPQFTVKKTPEIMARIERYRTTENPRSLSASSIKLYIGCPMAFYFEKIMGYRREDPVTDWIDESTYGTIVHEVFEHIYGGLLKGHESTGVTVTKEMLDRLSADTVAIDREITMAVNRNYYRLPDDRLLAPLKGDAKIIGLIIRDIMVMLFKREKDMAPFIYLHGEWEGTRPLVLNGTEGRSMTINFNCRIDRVDRYVGTDDFPRLRIIDYKTGSDRTDAVSAAQIFEKYDQKAFLQLMLYCQAYAQFTGHNDVIQPMVYQMRKAMIAPIEPLKAWPPLKGDDVDRVELKKPKRAMGKWNLLDYRDYTEEVNDILISYLEELFNPDEPFRCASDTDTCKLCAFSSICQRDIKR